MGRDTGDQTSLAANLLLLGGASGSAGAATRPWGFTLEEVRAEVVLWHGTEDSAAPLAAALNLRERLAGKRVALICSGGNISRAQLADALAAA